jgi:hypothetical protein
VTDSPDERLGENYKYLTGILFATAASIQTVPQLQEGIQGNACHLQFGKYTLFSAYGSTAVGSMFPIAFGIMFGNENKESWGEFWKFAAYHHPYLNDPKVTVITYQDKGSIHSIQTYLDAAHHYHCSWHRGGNIIKMCGGG